jgi:hypothetical protein
MVWSLILVAADAGIQVGQDGRAVRRSGAPVKTGLFGTKSSFVAPPPARTADGAARSDGPAAVGGQPVPQQGRLLPAKEPAQLAQGLDEGVGVVGVDMVVEGKGRAAATGAVAQGRGYGGRFHLNRWPMTGVTPHGAQVRRTTRSSETPDSSQNTTTARRRRVLRQILGPVLGHPAGDRLLVTLDRAAGRAL